MQTNQIGKYSILELLWQGASGCLYRCENTETRHELAIKVTRTLPDDVRVATLRSLDHPSIVQIYDFFSFEDRQAKISQAIVMEFVRGWVPRSLDYKPPSAAELSAEEIYSILIQIAEGLDHTHRRGIIHGRLSPRRILIRPDRQVKLTGFLPSPGSFLGNASYVAPEEVLLKPPTKAVDQYALALIAHEMLTGRHPWGTDPMAAFHFKLQDTYQTSDEVVQRLGGVRMTAMRRALDKDPLKRFDTCGEFIRSLK